MPVPSSTERPSTRTISKRCRWILGVVALVLLAAAARFSLLRGTFSSVRIAGGSMAGTLLGDHFEFVCTDCGMPFPCGVERVPEDASFACPNCGHEEVRGPALIPKLGDRVIVDAWTGWLSAPTRGQLVALRQPNSPAEWAVKRVAACPGERVAIRHGDLYVNDRIVRKTIAQFQELAVLVHDDRFRPRSSANLPSRWEADSATNHAADERCEWSVFPQGYLFDSPATTTSHAGHGGSPMRWLRYRHLCVYPSTARRGDEVPIRDYIAYDPATSRLLNPVTDLAVTCRLSLEKRARAAVKIDNGRERFLAEMDSRRSRFTVSRIVPSATEPTASSDVLEPIVQFDRWVNPEIAFELTVALCDQQILVAIGGYPMVVSPYQPGSGRAVATTRPIAIGAADGMVSVTELKVLRDLYYLAPDNLAHDWTRPQPLGYEEYFLLGDQSSVSVDSRHWSPGSVTRATLQGKVVPLGKRVR